MRTAARDLIAYLGTLTLAGGDRDGELFHVLPWEARFIRGMLRAEGDSALSCARGQGKSALVAGIACAVLDPAGPLHGRRREVVVVASSFAQAKIIFEDVDGMMRHAFPDLRVEFRVQDSTNMATITHRGSGARLRCIGSDPRRAHGLRPLLVLADEPAQWPPGTGEKMVSALRTGLGKVEHSRFVALGTRPAASDHWFQKLLDEPGPGGFSQVHAVPPDAPPFRLAAIRRANPTLDHLPSLRRRVLLERDEAKRDPSALATWRSLRLNQGVSDTQEAVLLEAEVWEAAESDAAERSGPCWWGIDLGTSAAQSAICGYWPETGRLEAVAAFPTEPSLEERGLRDGVGGLYRDCFRRGELILCGGAAVSVGEVVFEALRRFGSPAGIAADRWREAELRDVLREEGVPPAILELRGQGFKDGAEDVRQFRRGFLERKVSPILSLLMTSAMREARVVTDPAGSAKLAKKTEGGRKVTARDDAAAAAILAVAIAVRNPASRAKRSFYLGRVSG